MILGLTKGPQVEALQKKFNIPVTGEYDRKTQLAIIDWQLTNGLPANGSINELDWITLFGTKPELNKVTNESKVQKTKS